MPSRTSVDQPAARVPAASPATPAPGVADRNGAHNGAHNVLAQTGEYTIFGLPRELGGSEVRERQIGFTILLFVVATAIAVLYSAERYLYARLVHEPVLLWNVLPGELVLTYVWALLTPAAMAVARRFPVWGEKRIRNWTVELAAMVAFVLLHVMLFSGVGLLLNADVRGFGAARVFVGNMLAWTVVDCIVFCTIIAVSHATIYYRVSKDRALRASQLETRLAQAQLQVLRMQLQPHFLFNTLHSISALMHKDVKRADSMMAALSDLLRMSLQNIGAQEVPLQAELDFVQRYVDIMAMRFGDRLRVSLSVDPAVRDARVPNLLLQPLVENSFRHGFSDRTGEGSIDITVGLDGDMLTCDVVDTGRGLSVNHKEGVGLFSTRERLQYLYGNRHRFVIRGAPGEGVRVSLAIPYQPFDRATP